MSPNPAGATAGVAVGDKAERNQSRRMFAKRPSTASLRINLSRGRWEREEEMPNLFRERF